ncbi:unnamed protein product [Larinioides sclopetarius]|uniref:Granulin n=1 Tax=Larinioides sclopetarius TaxID=280406 RepID=A0AAV2B3G2_9ARAC
MKAFVLLVFIPSFITADILCPKSKITCPEDKKCCEVDGEYSCCDSDVDLEEPAKVYAGVEFVSLIPFANLSYAAYESNEIMDCKPPNKICGTQCCGQTDVCCGNLCCRITDTCCGSGCCRVTDICCGQHCCRVTDTCCGGGCCRILKKCCGNVCC